MRRSIKAEVVGKTTPSVQPMSFRKASREIVNIIANAVQLVLLLAFGYVLFAVVRIDDLSTELLTQWTGITALACGGLNLVLELIFLSGVLAKTFSAVEGFAYLFWGCSGSIGVPIIEPGNTQASLLKTALVLLLFVVWNGLQLSWRVSKFRAKRARQHLKYEDLVEPAKHWANQRGLSPDSKTMLLQELGRIVPGRVSRENARQALKVVEVSSPTHQFLEGYLMGI